MALPTGHKRSILNKPARWLTGIDRADYRARPAPPQLLLMQPVPHSFATNLQRIDFQQQPNNHATASATAHKAKIVRRPFQHSPDHDRAPTAVQRPGDGANRKKPPTPFRFHPALPAGNHAGVLQNSTPRNHRPRITLGQQQQDMRPEPHPEIHSFVILFQQGLALVRRYAKMALHRFTWEVSDKLFHLPSLGVTHFPFDAELFSRATRKK
jgi:hypothetical protein